MPKKKTPKNAFYYFMRDFREEQEQLGHNFRGGMKEVADLAGPAWKELSPEQRLHYENVAVQEKMKEKGNLENKFTTTGISYAQLQREEEERRNIEMRMKMEIEGTIQGLDRDTTLKTHVFYFIHFNYYCRIEDGSYLICEVAVVQFNLKDGVKDVYHTIIRQDKIPMGYSLEAKQTSETTHQIPLPHDLTEGEPYRGNVFCNIKSFIEKGKLANGRLPPLYSIDNHVDIAQCALTLLAENHYPQDVDIFRVYPLSKLFYHLRNAAATPGYPGFPAETLAERELDKDQYNFAPAIACTMHDKNDTCVFCSKSIVQRWAFLICDHCCRDLGIVMLRGKHVPINAAINVDLPSEGEPFETEEFQVVSRRNAGSSRVNGTPRLHAASSEPRARVPNPTPIRVVDHSRIGPPEVTVHQYSLNAAAARLPAVPSSSGPSTSSGPTTGAIPKASTNTWAARAAANTGVPPQTLRHPTNLPPSIANAIRFTAADFPDLGRRSNQTPAAVAGRGRGRMRMLIDENEAAPGGLNSSDGAEGDAVAGQVVSGRGRGAGGNRPGSRLAANFQGFSHS